MLFDVKCFVCQWKMFINIGSCFSKNHKNYSRLIKYVFLQWQCRLRRRWFCVEGCRGSVLTFSSDMVAWSGRGLVTCWHQPTIYSAPPVDDRLAQSSSRFVGRTKCRYWLRQSQEAFLFEGTSWPHTSDHSVSDLGHSYTPTFHHLHSQKVRTSTVLLNILIKRCISIKHWN